MGQPRIKFGMSMSDCVVALSEGNPGAMSVLIKLAQSAGQIDPESAMGALGPIFALATNGIYGSRIWLLYKDVCRENLVNMIGLLRAVQLGSLSEDALQRAIDGDRGAVNVAEQLAYVRSALSKFAAEEAV